MSAIYFHIPFCKKRCYYCDFFSSANLKNKNKIVDSLSREIRLRQDYLTDKNIETVYFGGGTPSLLSPLQIRDLIEQIAQYFQISPNAEITLEANPDDINADYVKGLVSSGINRMSLGIQSIFDEDLQLMNRRHNSQQGIGAVETIYSEGIENISVDLIYGLPHLTTEKWEKNLETVLKLPVKHLSAYHLTYESGTVFYKWLLKGKFKETDENESFKQFEILCDYTYRKNFRHYEISNFGLDGYFSKHNCSYWNGTHYLGIGPSAHSFNGKSRQWNVSDIHGYINALEKDQLNCEEEILDIKEKHNDCVITSLRTMWGLDLNLVEKNFGIEARTRIESKAGNLLKAGLAVYGDNRLILTKKGQFLSDSIMSDFMII